MMGWGLSRVSDVVSRRMESPNLPRPLGAVHGPERIRLNALAVACVGRANGWGDAIDIEPMRKRDWANVARHVAGIDEYGEYFTKGELLGLCSHVGAGYGPGMTNRELRLILSDRAGAGYDPDGGMNTFSREEMRAVAILSAREAYREGDLP